MSLITADTVLLLEDLVASNHPDEILDAASTLAIRIDDPNVVASLINNTIEMKKLVTLQENKDKFEEIHRALNLRYNKLKGKTQSERKETTGNNVSSSRNTT